MNSGAFGENHASIDFLYPIIQFEPIPSVIGREAGYIMDRSITGPHEDKRDKRPCTLTLTPRDSLETPINLTCMFLDGGRRPGYPERTHAYTGRTCKLHLLL